MTIRWVEPLWRMTRGQDIWTLPLWRTNRWLDWWVESFWRLVVIDRTIQGVGNIGGNTMEVIDKGWTTLEDGLENNNISGTTLEVAGVGGTTLSFSRHGFLCRMSEGMTDRGSGSSGWTSTRLVNWEPGTGVSQTASWRPDRAVGNSV